EPGAADLDREHAPAGVERHVRERRGHRGLADTALAGDDHEPLRSEGQVAGHDARDSRPLPRGSTRRARSDGSFVRAACSALAHAPRWSGAPCAATGVARPLRSRWAGPIAAAARPRMRYLVLATDYDGTIARDGRVDAATVAALESVRRSGRKIVLV